MLKGLYLVEWFLSNIEVNFLWRDWIIYLLIQGLEAEERFKDHTSKKVKVNGEIVNKPSVHVDALNQKVEYKDFYIWC